MSSAEPTKLVGFGAGKVGLTEELTALSVEMAVRVQENSISPPFRLRVVVSQVPAKEAVWIRRGLAGPSVMVTQPGGAWTSNASVSPVFPFALGKPHTAV